MAIELPSKKVEGTRVNAKRLVIYSKPKTGKTSLFALLDNNLIIDLENGSDYVSALKVKANSVEDIQAIGEEIKKQGKPYKYLTVDTVTVLEDMVKPLALTLFKKTAMGASSSVTDVLKLPNGAGYLYLREAFFKVLDYIDTLAENIILSGHLKDKAVNDSGEMVMAANIDLTGKIKSLICANADAVGYLFRDGNKTILSFESNDEVTCGARPLHLRNQAIVLGESDKDGNLTAHWDKIYV